MTDPMIGAAKKRFSVTDQCMHPGQQSGGILGEHRFPHMRILFCQDPVRGIPVGTYGGTFPGRFPRTGIHRGRVQRLHHGHLRESRSCPSILDGYDHLGFVLCPSSTLTCSRTAKKCIVHFDDMFQHISGIPLLKRYSDFVNHKPCRLIMDIQQLSQKRCGTSPFIRSHQIDGPKPLLERKVGAMEHGVVLLLMEMDFSTA